MKLNCDDLLSNFAFKFNVRHYKKAYLANRGLRGVYKGGIGSYSLALLTLFSLQRRAFEEHGAAGGAGQGLTLIHFSAQPEPFLTEHTLHTPDTP